MSRIKGSDMVAQGFARDVHDEQFNHIGFQLMPTRQMEQQQLSMHTSTGLVPRDVMLNAGTQFKHGKSRTAGMTEDQRLHRTHPTTGKLLPPEDAVELAQARVREWARKWINRNWSAPHLALVSSGFSLVESQMRSASEIWKDSALDLEARHYQDQLHKANQERMGRIEDKVDRALELMLVVGKSIECIPKIEERIKSLESARDQRLGAMAMLLILSGLIGAGITELIKHFFSK
jgi:hypothetical protein